MAVEVTADISPNSCDKPIDLPHLSAGRWSGQQFSGHGGVLCGS